MSQGVLVKRMNERKRKKRLLIIKVGRQKVKLNGTRIIIPNYYITFTLLLNFRRVSFFSISHFYTIVSNVIILFVSFTDYGIILLLL